MACFCTSVQQFHEHTFHPVLVPGVQEGHLLRLIGCNASEIETIKAQLRVLHQTPEVVSIKRREFVAKNGDHVFEALVVLARPEH